ncbi:type VI secretion system Vgr family protein [Vibrio scophthalmi]|uniref:VgrG protein n=1 Tax=Vibrio scophthalmi LMG 19158 TaxID=870967 RepID=F9RT90_9VIBR|nr:type VI secretion system tip protein VgrG [Vibrio scophthalmi]EGU31328.1 vgrG protein [Vibrio scophthalmi LMG 19158]
MATLNFNFHVDGLDENTFVVREYQGQETLSNGEARQGRACFGYHFDIALASRNNTLSAENIVDKNVQLEIVRNGEIVQRIHGIARNFTVGDTGHHHTFYQLTLVPALERLSLRHNSRIFQLQTVPEILSVLLQEMGIYDYAFSLKRDSLQREFCVQYRETDLDFLHRLAAEEGLVYSFIHEQGKHTLLFTDCSESQPEISMPVPYNALSGGIIDEPYISTFTTNTQSHPSHTALQDYSFKKPQYHFQQNTVGTEMNHQRTDVYEHFDAPGRFKDDETGKAFNQIRLEFLRRNAHTAQGKSNQPLLQAGYKFDLQEHLNSDNNRSWLIVSVEHKGTQPQALEEEGGSGATTYSNTFKAIPATINWQAHPTPKPQVDGPCIAVVVGPQGEEIFCDEHGRVKLHFPWDRYSNGDEKSSCWVRVSQGWAGSQYGMMTIPRIGHEVIVSFLHGDPDQPIITGRTYHASNVPPYTLPDNKTKTILRSETHQGEGFNELSFEDQSQTEKVYLHAQKDFEADVLNDHTTHIKRDKHLTVDNDRFTQIKNNHHFTVEGESRTKISKDKTDIVDGSAHHKVANKHALSAGSEVHIKAGAKVVLDAGTEITLKAGGSFVKVDPAGVHIVGAAINLNSGGSASRGSGFGGQMAVLPNQIDAAPADPSVHSLDNIDASLSALDPKLQSTSSPITIVSAQQKSALKASSAGVKGVCEVCKKANQ